MILFIVSVVSVISIFSDSTVYAGCLNCINVDNIDIKDIKDIKENTKTDEKKYIALTFDDGPHPVYTPKVLDILADKNIAATFFVLGYRARLSPELLQRMKELKCEIGNHTYDHVNLARTTKTETISQIDKCSEAIYAATGEYPKLYRPPFGELSKSNEAFVSLKKVLWTVDSADWRTKNADRIVKNVINDVNHDENKESIILMHDFYDQTVESLPQIIDILINEGYEFVTVSELEAKYQIKE